MSFFYYLIQLGKSMRRDCRRDSQSQVQQILKFQDFFIYLFDYLIMRLFMHVSA